MTRAEMLARISARELSQWMALYRVESKERTEAEREAAEQPTV